MNLLSEVSTPTNLSDEKSGYGVVYKKNSGIYGVFANGKELPCALSSLLRKKLIYPTADPNSLRPVVREVKEIKHVDPIAVGDVIRYLDAGDGTGVIIEVKERRSKLTRRTSVPMPTAHAFEQVIVANLDQIVPVFAAANPVPKWNMLDRYLVSAESLDLPSLICINKIDLVDEFEGDQEEGIGQVIDDYQKIGYPVLMVSALEGIGLSNFKQALKDKVSVLVGKSGVGKTSLLNALQPGLGQQVNEVNQKTGKGKHTTTSLEMFSLDSGGWIIDTPGVREFGPWNLYPENLAMYFPEIRPYIGQCKFGLGCAHDVEPGCAVRQAVMNGDISPRRYKSYMCLAAEV